MNVMMVVVKAMTTANVNTTEDSPPEFVPESLRGFMTNSEWDELLSRADYLITSLESIDDSNTRQSVFELLKVCSDLCQTFQDISIWLVYMEVVSLPNADGIGMIHNVDVATRTYDKINFSEKI